MRIIARLDIKNKILIKSITFDGVKKLGDPEIFAKKYFELDIDELMIINNTGSLYNTVLDNDQLKKIRNKKIIPISAGGGISCYDDAKKLIENGCDKIVINSLIHKNLKEVEKIVNNLGSSSVTGAIQYEKKNEKILTFYEMARESTNLTLNETLNLYKESGIGEVLLTDVSRDGCFTGCSEEIIDEINMYNCEMPILIGGGFVDVKQLETFKNIISGIVISSAFHYEKISVKDIVDYRNASFTKK